MKNIDGVDLGNLIPNEADPLYGWKDVTTGKNYRLVDDEGYFISAPLIEEYVVEIRQHPVESESYFAERTPENVVQLRKAA